MRTAHNVAALRRHPLSSLTGALAGFGLAAAWLTWVVNFAPFDNEASSLWQTKGGSAEGTLSAEQLYQPRVDELLRRVRVDGRFGGMAWQNFREATEGWLLADPIAALNYLIKNSAVGLIDDALLDSAVEVASKGNFSVAFRLAEEIGSAPVRTRWITRAFEQLVTNDPRSALLALDSMPPELTSGFALGIADRWGATEPERAFEMFLQHNPRLAGFVASSWARHDPEKAFTFFNTASSRIQSGTGQSVSSRAMLNSALQDMTGGHPEIAIRLLATVPDGGIRAGHLQRGFYTLAERDSRRAVELANQLPGDLERLESLATIATSVQRRDPALASEIRASIPGERARSNSEARRVWDAAHYEHPEDAVATLAKIKDPLAYHDAQQSVALVWLSKKPEEFAIFASEQSRSGDVRWIRAMADLLVDSCAHGTPSTSELTQNLTPQALSQLRHEITVQSPPDVREKLLTALAAQ